MASPRPSKAPSITSSAGTNKSISLPFLPRYTPKPEPAYISPAAAADFVLHNGNEDHFDQISPSASPTNESAVFTDRSLSLLNTFLDSLLYNFLAKARGTSLSQLKPAITEVLKAKLARDALASADEELEGLVSEADLDEEEDITTFGGQEGWSQEWHLEMAFKRMRLRVMVFIRLGDFDDEDEERFLDEEDDLRNGDKPEQEEMLASPAAVYLAGVLEYIAERALSIVGDAAVKRASGKTHRRSASSISEVSNGMGTLIVHDVDVEKITLNPTLGRLWRTWRKNYRVMHASSGSNTLSPYAPPSPTTDKPFRGRLGSLNETMATTPQPSRDEREDRHLSADEIPEGDVLESDIAANIPLPMSENDIDEIETIELPDQEAVAEIPLPMSDNDIREIEIPGLAKEVFDDEHEPAEEADSEPTGRRPLSAILSWLTPFSWAEEKPERPKLQRMRSSSVPNRARPTFLGSAAFTPAVEEPEPVLDPMEPAAEPEAEDLETVGAPTSAKEDATVHEQGVVNDAEAQEDEQTKEAEEAKPGLIAGAVAGAAAIATSAAAVVIGTSKSNKEAEAEFPSKTELTPAAKSEAEKPKPSVSNSIADRRRMFEAQAKLANNKMDSSASREVSPAPPEEQVLTSEPSSSLRTKAVNAAAIPAAVAAGMTTATPAAMDTPGAVVKEVDPRVDRKAAAQPPAPPAEEQPVHDEKAIGVARTSDVPVPYPTSTSTSPPPERQRSYHLPSSQAPSDKTTSRDRTLVGADEYLMNRAPEAPKSTSSPLRASIKPKEEVRQNGISRVSNNAPQAVTFFHDEDEQPIKIEQPIAKTIAEPAKHRPPPLKMDTAAADTVIRPTSAARSATSTPGGHSTKGSSSSSNMQRQLDKKSLEESRQRDFDSLLKNNEPVKYTLTPEDLRTTEVRSVTVASSRASALADRGPPSPRIISSPTTYTAKRSSPPRDSSSSRRETPSPTIGLINGRKAGVPRVSEYKRTAAHRLSQRPETLNTNSRTSGFMPREPRVMTDNTADLADYMASTAPTHEQPVLPLVHSSSNPKLQNGARTSSPLPRSLSRQKLTPREPDLRDDGTSDLIDFIRQGPPGSKPEKDQRRTVAPFRTTMDSDDLHNLGDFATSVHTSLGGNKKDTIASSMGSTNNGSAARTKLVTPGPPTIVKKQRRVKDPYAIDSDDDDDFLSSIPEGGRAVQEPKEESLADFLRNSEPPSNNAPQLLNGASSRPSNRTGNSYGSSLAPNSARSAMMGSGSTMTPAQRAKFEARAAGATRNGFGGNGFYYSTNDMADFLRSSGPVENMAPTQQQPVPLQKKPSRRLVGGFMSRA